MESEKILSLEKRCGCTIAYGKVPLSVLHDVINDSPGDTVFFDTKTARSLGASFVLGTERNLEELRRSLEIEGLSTSQETTIRRDQKQTAPTIPAAVQKWLSSGDRGLSSDTMCRRFFGVPKGENTVPLDPSDFVLCLKFLEETKTQNRINEMKSVSKEWEGLVANWNALTRMLDKDLKKTGGRSAPDTYLAMKCLEALAGRGQKKKFLESNIDKVFQDNPAVRYVAAVVVDYLRETTEPEQWRRHFDKNIREDLLATEVEIGGRLLSVCLHGKDDVTRSEAIDLTNLRTGQTTRILLEPKEHFLRDVVHHCMEKFSRNRDKDRDITTKKMTQNSYER